MSTVVLNPGTGGSTITTETIVASGFEMPVSKIRTGASGTDASLGTRPG